MARGLRSQPSRRRHRAYWTSWGSTYYVKFEVSVLKNVRYLESVSFVGKSKLPANYDFGIPKSKKYPERLIKIRSSIASIFDYSTLAGLVCLILVGVLILVAAIYFVVKALLRRQTLSTDFHDVMLQNTAGTLREAVYPGSFSWGEEKPSNIARISSTGGSRKILF